MNYFLTFSPTNLRKRTRERRNLAIKKAKGTYISFLDTDDLWKKNYLKTFVNEIKKKIEIENIKTQISLKSLISNKFSIENLSIGDSVFMYGVVVGKAKKRILVLGSDGLVGSAIKKSHYFGSENLTHFSNRQEADLIELSDVQNLFNKVNPDIVINCAGKVGGILANSTQRYEFLTENLKMNLPFLVIYFFHQL